MRISPFLPVAVFTISGVCFGADSAKDAAKNLAALLAGNQRFAAGAPTRPHQDTARRAELLSGQKPFAAVLSCADSRVPPELLFDAGLGDIFVVRVAGNVASEEAIGSLEYAVEHLHTNLVVVLGHQKCGAVDATVKAKAGESGSPRDHIESLINAIRPAVDSVKGQSGDPVALAVKANVVRTVELLRNTGPILKEKVEKGEIKVVGAIYDLASGQVTVLP